MKPGDIVTLISGGPKMAVYQIYNDSVYCQWFDASGKCHQSGFVEEVLVRISPEERAALAVRFVPLKGEVY